MSTFVTHHRSRPHADSPVASRWEDLAACTTQLAEFESSEAAARKVCAVCPVSSACLSAALQEEGAKPKEYRYGVRGGLVPAERAARARSGPRKPPRTVGEYTGDSEQAEALLRAGELCAREIADATGMSRDSVARLRRSLGLQPVPDPAAPQMTPLARFTRRTVPGPDGHLLWTGGPAVDLGGRREVSGLRLAFRLGYGRDPVGLVKARCGTARCVAWRHLADRPMRRSTIRTPRPPAAPPVPAGHLYGIEPGHWAGEEWVAVRVVRFPITRKTPRRVFYVRREDPHEIGSVDRQRIEADGDVYRAASGWWEADSRLFLAPPDLDEYLRAEKPQPLYSTERDAPWLDAAAAAA